MVTSDGIYPVFQKIPGTGILLDQWVPLNIQELYSFQLGTAKLAFSENLR